MNATIAVLNRLERDGVVKQYAVAGGVAATFYMEPLTTYDLDVFILVESKPGKLISLAPIYDYLAACGFKTEREYVMIHGMPVQFIPTYNRLSEEALEQARTVKYSGAPVRVIRPEHVLAIMLQTGRPKDLIRARQLAESAGLNRAYLLEVLKRHNLTSRWRALRRKSG